jgi:hypothetical protein
LDYTELVERVGWGEEFSFYYHEERYWISRNENGYYLTREKDSFTQSFKNPEELFKYGRIEGKTILELWNLIEI